MDKNLFFIRKFLLFFFIFLSSFKPLFASEKDLVTVSILPQKYFLEKIVKDILEVNVMVSPGASPASYEPKPSQLLKLSKSKIYFSIGVPFEKVWLSRFSKNYPKLLIVPTDKGIEKISISPCNHASSNKREDLFPDPHIWLDPGLVLLQLDLIYKALLEEFPEFSEIFTLRYNLFKEEIIDLDSKIRDSLSLNEARSFFVFHPSWAYFAKAYNLRQIPIETAGRDPSPKELALLISMAREERALAVFVQAQFSQRAAKIIADALAVRLVVLDPLAENWSENLLQVAMVFSEFLD